MAAVSTHVLLRRLGRIARQYEPGAAARKEELVRALASRRFSDAKGLYRLHEELCFLRAFPDDPNVLEAVEEALTAFAQRPELPRLREELVDTGIAGAPIRFPFHWVTARWLAKHFGDALSVDWDSLEERDGDALVDLLPLLVPYAEGADLEPLKLTPKEWLGRLAGARESDAVFLVRRFEALGADEPVREAAFHDLRLPMQLTDTSRGPSRSLAKLDGAPQAFRSRPFTHVRPDLRQAVRTPPVSVLEPSKRDRQRILHLAREAMVTRSRDLDAIMYASKDDVRLVDAGDGLAFACIGLLPQYRAVVETLYVFLLLQNGVPIGYYQAALLFGSAELNYNVFEPYRGTRTAHIYGRAMAMVHHLFGADVFAVHPYQLGKGNPEALASGAFWFYQKLGFRSDNPRVNRVLKKELARLQRNSGHRSSPRTLDELASDYLYFSLGRARSNVAGRVSLSRIALAISDHTSSEFGSDREHAARVQMARARAALGAGPDRSWTATERLWWRRLAPLVSALDVEEWSRPERRALLELIRLKGGVREAPFARQLARHARLQKALLRLAKRPV